MTFGISFDFWNTLFGNGDEPARHKKRIDYFHRIVSTYIKSDYTAVENAFRESTQFFLHEWQNNYRTPTASERIRYMSKFLGVTLSNDDIKKTADYFGQLIFIIPPEKNPENIRIIKELSEKYPLGLISDTGYISGKYIRQFLIQEDLITSFSSLFFSDEHSHSKPHLSVFKSTCTALNISCSQLIHIGDLEKTDMKGASDSGGIGIKYTAWNNNKDTNSMANYTIGSYKELYEIITNIVNR